MDPTQGSSAMKFSIRSRLFWVGLIVLATGLVIGLPGRAVAGSTSYTFGKICGSTTIPTTATAISDETPPLVIGSSSSSGTFLAYTALPPRPFCGAAIVTPTSGGLIDIANTAIASSIEQVSGSVRYKVTVPTGTLTSLPSGTTLKLYYKTTDGKLWVVTSTATTSSLSILSLPANPSLTPLATAETALATDLGKGWTTVNLGNFLKKITWSTTSLKTAYKQTFSDTSGSVLSPAQS